MLKVIALESLGLTVTGTGMTKCDQILKIAINGLPVGIRQIMIVVHNASVNRHTVAQEALCYKSTKRTVRRCVRVERLC